MKHVYRVNASTQEVFRAHTSIELLAKVLPDLRISGATDVSVGVALEVEARLFSQRFRASLRVEELVDDSVICYRMVDGPIKSLSIKERLNAVDDATEVSYSVEYDAPFTFKPFLNRVLRHLLRRREDLVKWKLGLAPLGERIQPLTLPLPLGNLVQAAGLILATLLLVASVGSPLPLDYLLALVAWLLYFVAPHCLAHYIIGRVVGIRFSHYYLGLSNIYRLRIPLPASIRLGLWALGIKSVPESLRAASPASKAVMYASGAVASMLLPFTVPLYLLYRGVVDTALFFTALSALNAGFSLYFSPRAGDLWKARRSLH